MSAVLLDTSALIYLFEHHHEHVAGLVKQSGAKPVLSIVSRGELERGVASSATPDIRAARLETKRQAVAVARWVQIDDEIADRWGELAGVSPRAVRANDLWIAATSLVLGITLITGDEKLAALVDGYGITSVLVRR